MNTQIKYTASRKVKRALVELGRTEDLKLSPDNQRLALAGFSKDKILVIDIQFDYSATSTGILLTDYVEITSPCLKKPHGLSFMDNETLVVGNRFGDVSVLQLPPSGSGNKEHILHPLQSIKGFESRSLHSPGSVSVSLTGNGLYEVLVCNNYIHYVTRHILNANQQLEIDRDEVLLHKHLEVPDGIAMSSDQQWIAVSNHKKNNILVFENTDQLGRHSDPSAVLRYANYPHGVRFTADNKFIVTADAGAPFVHVYAIGSGGWLGVHQPITSIRVMDDETFALGHYNPQEGGPKGVDIDNEMKVLVVTSAHQLLAFSDLAEVLGPFRAGLNTLVSSWQTPQIQLRARNDTQAR
jgi:DNA-binding beta-propeller fold protein YncE